MLKQVRRALLAAFVFSGAINILMLATPLYTLQVFESVVPLLLRADSREDVIRNKQISTKGFCRCFNTGCCVHSVADHCILHPFLASDGARDRSPSMQTHSNIDGILPSSNSFFIEGSQLDTHFNTSANGMVGIFHGPAVYTEQDKYKKVDFKDIEKGKKGLYTAATDNGWIGMVEHYFVNAWLPKAGSKREYYTTKEEGELYRAGLKTPVGDIAAGASGKVSVPIYMGPQEQDRLKAAATGLDLVVDYGMFTFIAAPMFWLLRWFHSMVANWGWAIVLLTILIKGVFYPLNAAAGRSMGKMKLVGPKLKEIQTRYADDRMKLNQAMMELYKKEKINPLGGCLPIVIQIPVFIALYWVLIAAVELRHAPWIGWIKDLSGPDPWFVLPVLYAITAFAQSKLQPPAPGMDPIQQKVLQYMPVAFAVMFVFFPAGLVLYWTVSNLLQIAQQWQINRMLEKESAAAAAAAKR